MKKRHTVTAALPYANGGIHIGHLAGVYVPADVYVRFLRMKEEDVIFVCGTDEHGVPITIKARNEGVSPAEVTDKYHALISESLKDFGISFDIFGRTSSEVHHETSSEFFKKLNAEGKFIKKSSEQYFDEEAGQFLADRYIVGTCPNCGFDGAYGDQCESCGSSLSPNELKDPKSMLSGAAPVKKQTEHWYLPLNDYEPFLKKWILKENKDWKVNVYGQCKSWLDQGLQPRAVTRDLDWGVQVPVEGADGKVLYVWFDAPIGYISFTRELMKQRGREGDWKRYWQDEETSLVHFIGKDNIVFHCIIFPSMMKAHGDYVMPENVPANEFMNLEGNKISTSRNWAVWLHEYLEDFKGKEDVLRYVLLANLPETKDNDFSWKDFQARNNNELVAILGNFINRSLVLTHKYYEGEIPEPGETFDLEAELNDKLGKIPEAVDKALSAYKFREALSQFMELARAGNKYLAETEPWKLQKSEPERVRTIMFYSLQVAANLAILGRPFLPNSMKRLQDMLNLEEGLKWSDTGRNDLLMAGHKIAKSELLFEKIEDTAMEAQYAKLEAAKKENAAKDDYEEKEKISFEDFTKLDLKVAEIKSAEKVKKADKLLKINLEVGGMEKTVVSGIAKYFKPEELPGKQVLYLSNLEPRKIRGVISEGMILMAEDSDGSLRLMQPSEKVIPGAGVS